MVYIVCVIYFLLSCITVTLILVYGMQVALTFACYFQIPQTV